MLIQTSQNIKLDGKRVGVLKVYLKGSGNPAENHSIIGFSIDGQGQGELPKLTEIGKFENFCEDITLAGAF